MRSVSVPVVEGESERPEDCIALGECVIRDLPPGLPQGTPIEVEYRYAANGRISVFARVPSVRYSAHVEINRDEVRNLARRGDLAGSPVGRGPSGRDGSRRRGRSRGRYEGRGQRAQAAGRGVYRSGPGRRCRAACPGCAGEARPKPSTGPGRGFHAPPGGRSPARSRTRVQRRLAAGAR